MQVQQDRTHIVDDLMKFMNMHFAPANGYYAFGMIACRQLGHDYFPNPKWDKEHARTRKRTVKRLKGLYQCRFFKNSEIAGENIDEQRRNELVDFFIHCIDKKRTYYLTAHGFNSSTKRDREHLSTLENIVIDIDIHKEHIKQHELAYALECLDFFLEDVFQGGDLPIPNTIVHTGRGVQIWWALHAVPVSLLYMYDYVRNYLITAISSLLQGVETLHEFHIDMNASHNYVGLYRLPGSYNVKARTYGYFRFYNEEPMNLAVTFFKLHPKKQQKQDEVNSICAGSIKCAYFREKKLTDLVELRKSRGISMQGLRDLCAMVLFSAYVSYGATPEAAYEAVDRINATFDIPMSEHEIHSYMSSCEKKKYKFSNKTIIDILDIDEDEQNILHFHPANEREKQRQQKREAKKERNRQIIVMLGEGRSQQAVAEALGCSQATVSRVARMEKEVITEQVEEKPALDLIRPEEGNKEEPTSAEQSQEMRAIDTPVFSIWVSEESVEEERKNLNEPPGLGYIFNYSFSPI
jgi:transcriptional regulator with XRE-family HTH domain